MRDLRRSKEMKIRRADPGAGERHRDNVALIRKAIQNIENKLETNEVKATIGDFIRLLQMEKELEIEEPRDIKVTWVDSNETEVVSEK
jgi:hypothetical protein